MKTRKMQKFYKEPDLVFPTHFNPNKFPFNISSNFTPIHVYPRLNSPVYFILRPSNSISASCNVTLIGHLLFTPTNSLQKYVNVYPMISFPRK